MRTCALLLAVFCACSSPSPATPKQQAKPAPASTCALAIADRLWLQEALDLWAFASERLLLLGDRPLPWMIFFDARCAFHIEPDRRADPQVGSEPVATLRAGAREVAVYSRAHEGGLVLPDGERRPLGPVAFASVYQRDKRPFSYFVLALMSVWSTHPKVKDGTSVSERILTVAVHELAHTQQLIPLQMQVNALPAAPASLSDDVVEEAFRGNTAYREIFFAERDLLFRAAA
ncbi:MAG TPA: hypothetical protein VFB62_18140, partial [Polyangiaceae bacterium]|nr:hypothetical protein [Polyangiaceae bacterium]